MQTPSLILGLEAESNATSSTGEEAVGLVNVTMSGWRRSTWVDVDGKRRGEGMVEDAEMGMDRIKFGLFKSMKFPIERWTIRVRSSSLLLEANKT